MADTKIIIECPACGKPMKKVFIEDGGINVDICTEGCGGIFFDNRELEKISNNGEKIDVILKEVEGKTFDSINEKEVRICPVCNAGMVKMGAGVSNVQIDVCNTCGAKFLDNGELQKIKEATSSDAKDVDAIVSKIYQYEAKAMLGKNFGKEPVTKGLRVALEKWISKHI